MAARPSEASNRQVTMMNTHKIVSAASLLVLFAVPSLPQPVESSAPEVTTWSTRSFQTFMTVAGKRFSFELTDEDLTDTPSWDTPEETDPPLTMATAISASKQDLPLYFPQVTAWHLDEISLRSLGDKQKWYWVVGWRPDAVDLGDSLEIPVLMNGRVVKLTVEDNPPNESITHSSD